MAQLSLNRLLTTARRCLLTPRSRTRVSALPLSLMAYRRHPRRYDHNGSAPGREARTAANHSTMQLLL
ncbi:hypothetical protein VTO73DRAFT_14867 [Trametes versicolor]